jgi:two-component system, OmpR family, response regulator
MKKTILLIGREPQIREELRGKLEALDYEVRWSADGRAELDGIDNRQADILLIDLDVPPAESLEILARIAAINPALRVVGLTARLNQSTAGFGTRVGAVVEKPIDLGGLLRAMEELPTHMLTERGGFRLESRRAIEVQENSLRRLAEANICPAAYSGWGINE